VQNDSCLMNGAGDFQARKTSSCVRFSDEAAESHAQEMKVEGGFHCEVHSLRS
jgi:hypothetical protein